MFSLRFSCFFLTHFLLSQHERRLRFCPRMVSCLILYPQVSCSREVSFPGVPMERRYGLLVMSDYSRDDIHPPNLIVDGLGRECNFVESHQKYECPDPKSADHKIRMVSHNNQDIKYVIHSSDSKVEVRLADMQLTIPFTYDSSKLFLSAIAGQQTRKWPITFAGTAFPSILGLLGWILAIILGFLLFALLLVVGLSSIFGLGVPLGATEIAATMTFIIQYLCFANYIRVGYTYPSIHSRVPHLHTDIHEHRDSHKSMHVYPHI